MAGSSLKTFGFKEFADLLNPTNFEPRLKKQVKESMDLIGLVAGDAILKAIDERQPPPGTSSSDYANKPRTIAMKGNDTPLVGEAPASLRASIAHEVKSWKKVIVGVLRNRTEPGKDGKPDDVISIAAIVHQGATIAVTDKMRAFMALQGFPLKPETIKIRIPGRPFLLSVLKKEMMTQYKTIWNEAIQVALAGRG